MSANVGIRTYGQVSHLHGLVRKIFKHANQQALKSFSGSRGMLIILKSCVLLLISSKILPLSFQKTVQTESVAEKAHPAPLPTNASNSFLLDRLHRQCQRLKQRIKTQNQRRNAPGPLSSQQRKSSSSCFQQTFDKSCVTAQRAHRDTQVPHIQDWFHSHQIFHCSKHPLTKSNPWRK